MKYIFTFESFNNNCTEYFDFKSLNDYVEFEKPLYSIIQKRKTAKLLYLSPDEYISIIANNFNLPIEYIIGNTLIDFDLVDEYANAMKNGDKFPIPYYRKNTDLQEGRHRVLACKKLGCTEIPVIEFREIDDDEFTEIIDKIKDYTFDELNIYFKELGLGKISMLGYNDLKRYVEYNLEINENNKIKLTDKQIDSLSKLPEQGMGYQIVDIKLKNGKLLNKKVVLNSTYIKVDKSKEFDASDIDNIYISENMNNLTLYHASNNHFDKFTYDNIPENSGDNKHGYGVYLSDSDKSVHSYITNEYGYIYTVNIDKNLNILDWQSDVTQELIDIMSRVSLSMNIIDEEKLKEINLVDDSRKNIDGQVTGYLNFMNKYSTSDLKKHRIFQNIKPYSKYKLSISDIYEQISEVIFNNNDKYTSEFFLKCGIDGIYYKEEYTYYSIYNIFNVSNINIIDTKKVNKNLLISESIHMSNSYYSLFDELVYIENVEMYGDEYLIHIVRSNGVRDKYRGSRRDIKEDFIETNDTFNLPRIDKNKPIDNDSDTYNVVYYMGRTKIETIEYNLNRKLAYALKGKFSKYGKYKMGEIKIEKNI